MDIEQLQLENERLREDNALLLSKLEEIRSKLSEPAEIIRAIQQGEIEALVVQQQGNEELFALQRFDSVYRTVVEECFPYGVWLAEPDGKMLYVTPTFLELLDTSLSELQEKGQFHFLPPLERKRVEPEWERCRKAKLPCDVEYSVKFSDGTERTIWTRGLLTETFDGRSRWVGVNIDVTESKIIKDQLRQQAEALLRSEAELRQKAEALKEADRRKDEFLALLGHELRNPLAPLRNGLHILLMPNVSNTAAKQVNAMMEKQIQHLSRLVDDLLNVSRITRGKIQLRTVKVPLGAAVEQAISSVRSLLELQGHTLTVTLPAEPVYLKADPTRLEQIFVNLLNNAAKYTHPGGKIEISAECTETEVTIRVKDTGVGIPEALLPKIFDLFTQAESSLDRSQGGLGIGLTLVKKLVELHGGTISAFSDGPGKGSEFVVCLPTLSESDHVEAENDPEPLAGGGRRMRVLVVEDSIDSAHSLTMLLELAGHAVCAVHDGPSAIDIYRTFQPDVVLLDIGLPGMNGYEVARQLRIDAGDRNPLIVAVSGYGHEEDKRRSEEAGCNYHLTKPIDPARLGELIHSAQ